MFNPVTRPWEKYFTIVQYDQRGSGKTLRRNPLKPSELSFDRLAQDGIEATDYLKKHLQKDKVILAASSVGTTFGLMMAKARPDLFYAFVGTDQNSFPESNKLTYELTLKWLREAGNKKGVKAVEAIGPDYTKWTQKQSDELIQWTIKANSHVPDMVMDVIFPALLNSPAHTMRDIRDVQEGIEQSITQLFKELMSYDARKVATEFKIPFFVFQGDTDAITPVTAAREYFDMIKAPHKEFVLIKNSGHLAAFARPEQFLKELVQRVRPYATQPTKIDDAK